MSDFLSGLGGIIKGMQPLMDEEARNDVSMNAFLLQSDVSSLAGKKRDVFARIGEAVCAAQGQYPEFSALCDEAAILQKQLDAKKAQMEAAKQEAEQLEKQKQRERDACTSRNCGYENEPDVKFCGECGEKLGLPPAANCPKCGEILKQGVKFCGSCGTKL